MGRTENRLLRRSEMRSERYSGRLRWLALAGLPLLSDAVDRAGRLRVLSIEVSEEFDPLLASADADCRIYYLEGQPETDLN